MAFSHLLPRVHPRGCLAFLQHYKAEITSDQKESLKAVLRAQPHAQITPEIRRELFSATARGETNLPSAARRARPEGGEDMDE